MVVAGEVLREDVAADAKAGSASNADSKAVFGFMFRFVFIAKRENSSALRRFRNNHKPQNGS
jgi:hypothetical protein